MRKPNIKHIRIKCILIVIVCLFFAFPANAQTTSQKIENLEKEKQETESDLKEQQGQIDSMKGQKSDLEGYLSNLNTKLSDIGDRLSDLEGQLSDKETEIADTEAALEAAKAKEAEQYAAMKKRIQFMYEKSDDTYMEMLFTASSFGDFLNRTNYINQLEEYDRNMLLEYQNTRDLIKQKEDSLVKEKEELDGLKSQVESDKKQVSSLIGDTSSKISDYSDDIAAAEDQAKAYEDDIKAKDSTLEELQRELAAEKAAEEEAARTQKFAETTITTEASSSSDLALLAAIIECEAGGEPYEGKLAVGHVVLNRVASNRFPGTILEVLYQKNQFTPVMSGRFAIVLARGANSTCTQAAQEVLNGAPSNVGDLLHFRTVTPYIDGLVIGGHVFY